MMTAIYYILIVVAALIYLCQDGLNLLADIASFVVFTVLVLYVGLVAIPCIAFLAGMLVVGPVTRVILRVDTSEWTKPVLKWLMRPLDARWFSKLISPPTPGGKKTDA